MGPSSCWKMSHVGEKHWAGDMRLLLGTVSVGFPSAQCACCKHRRNELLTARMVYNALKFKGRLLFSMRKCFLHKPWAQIPLMKRHSDTGLAELWPPRWPDAPSVCHMGQSPRMLQYINGSVCLYLNRIHAAIAALRQMLRGFVPWAVIWTKTLSWTRSIAPENSLGKQNYCFYFWKFAACGGSHGNQ